MLSLKVPPLGESIVEATVSRWHKNVGDTVGAGETVVELDTDKITVEVPAIRAGVLTKRSVDEGVVVKVGDLLGEIDETAVSAAVGGGAGTSTARVNASPSAPSAGADASAPAAPSVSGQKDIKSAPAARRLAEARRIDLSTIQGTGRGGVVSKPDVLSSGMTGAAAGTPGASTIPVALPQFISAPAHPDGQGTRETREKMTTRRKRIAENLLQAHLTTAHLTTFNEIDMSAVIALRERVKERTEKQHGVKLSFMPFFVRAACLALRDFPTVNAQIEGEEIVYKHYVNLGIAVASEQGLVVPNIKDADRKGVLDISREIVELAQRARATKLTMDDLTGGTFTITNGGVFGSLLSTPIINYPQVGILGLHKTQERPVAVDGAVQIRPMMYIALSYDHRLVEGEHAVRFLVRVKELMEEPGAMLIS